MNFLNWFNGICDTENVISKEEVSRFIADDIVFYLNGKLLAEGLEAYFDRVTSLRESVKQLQIKFPVENIVVENNKAAVNYLETLVHRDDSSFSAVDGMFLQFNAEGKITHLYDVFSGSDPVKGK
jgi:hypothetical protein